MRAVVFDMDGLMFDTERVCVMAWDYAGEKMGLGKTGYMTIKTLGMTMAKAREVWQAEFGECFTKQSFGSMQENFVLSIIRIITFR